MKKTYEIEIDCANCANLVEDAISHVEGVERASVSFITRKMKISFADNADVDSVLTQIERTAKNIEPDFAIL